MKNTYKTNNFNNRSNVYRPKEMVLGASKTGKDASYQPQFDSETYMVQEKQGFFRLSFDLHRQGHARTFKNKYWVFYF